MYFILAIVCSNYKSIVFDVCLSCSLDCVYLQGRISGDQLVNKLSSISQLGDLTTNSLDTEQNSSISLGELPSAITYRYLQCVYMRYIYVAVFKLRFDFFCFKAFCSLSKCVSHMFVSVSIVYTCMYSTCMHSTCT